MHSNKSLAFWVFSNYDGQLFSLKEQDLENDYQKYISIWNLFRVIRKLHEESFLLINKVEFGRALSNKEINCVHSNPMEIIDLVVDSLHKVDQPIPIMLYFTGSSIFEKGNEQLCFEDVVRMEYNLFSGELRISLHSDCFLPVSIDDKIQLEVAESSRIKLENFLSYIKKVSSKRAIPNEEEEDTDSIYNQRGFRVFMPDYALTFVDKSALSEDEIRRIESFMWKNRY